MQSRRSYCIRFFKPARKSMFKRTLAVTFFLLAAVMVAFAFSDSFGRWVTPRLIVAGLFAGIGWKLGVWWRKEDRNYLAPRTEDLLFSLQWVLGILTLIVGIFAPSIGKTMWIVVILGGWWVSVSGIRYTLYGFPDVPEPKKARKPETATPTVMQIIYDLPFPQPHSIRGPHKVGRKLASHK